LFCRSRVKPVNIMNTPLNLADLKSGSLLPELRKAVIQDDINLYAQASRDNNPIHIDENFARQTPLGGTIAHGMLILAYASQMMTAAFGQSWLTGGKFNIRFKAPARPGDTITVQGKVEKIQKENEQTLISCNILCYNQKGETVITGEATVRINNNENSN
jgi:3-hydroxybutyryl-CoA dehydratase